MFIKLNETEFEISISNQNVSPQLEVIFEEFPIFFSSYFACFLTKFTFTVIEVHSFK